MVKNRPTNAGKAGLIPRKIPWKRKWQPTPEMDREAWGATVYGVTKRVRRDLVTEQQQPTVCGVKFKHVFQISF